MGRRDSAALGRAAATWRKVQASDALWSETGRRRVVVECSLQGMHVSSNVLPLSQT